MVKAQNPVIYYVLFVIGTLFSGFALYSILQFTDPHKAGMLVFLFLYFSLFLFTTSLFAAVGLWARRRTSSGMFMAQLAVALRQAVLFAVLVVLHLFLLRAGMLTFWVALGIFVVTALIEGYFLTKP